MNERFTKGPWEVVEGADQMCHPGSTIEWNENLKAGIFSDHMHGDRKADLVLKSAAPELYEALKQLTEAVERMGFIPARVPELSNAKSALTKATTI